MRYLLFFLALVGLAQQPGVRSGYPTSVLNQYAPGSTNNPVDLGKYNNSRSVDARNFGAVGFTGNCHTLTYDNEPALQAALNFAYATGPLDVFLPPGFCYPIGSHVWVPPGVTFYSVGRGTGYETSSAGGLLIANANWGANNTTFPFNYMVWITGDNYTSPPYGGASNVSFAGNLSFMEVNCNDQLGCLNVFAVGRQEKSTVHDVVMTGGVPFTGQYGIGFYEQGVDCNGATPPAYGCLVPKATSPATSNPFSGQQGPDYNIEIFPSYNAPSAYFIPWVIAGAANYKGLANSTLNCNGSGSPAGAYFWGSDSIIGPGVHMEQCGGGTNYFELGVAPNATGCNGVDHSTFMASDPTFLIQSCQSQVKLNFLGVYGNGNSAGGGIVNNQSGAPVVNLTDTNYYWDSSGSMITSIGNASGNRSISGFYSSDPGQIIQIGYQPFMEYVGTPYSGWNAGTANVTGAAAIRGYSCGNIHFSSGSANWPLGGDGGSDYSCLFNFNGGTVGFSGAGTTTSPVSTSTILTNAHLMQSGTTGNVLLGTGWMNLSNGVPMGEGSAAVQVHGGIGGDVQSANAAGCTTGATVGATCTTSVTWNYSYSSSVYDVQCSGINKSGTPVVTDVAPSSTGVVVTTAALTATASGYSKISCFANSQ